MCPSSKTPADVPLTLDDRIYAGGMLEMKKLADVRIAHEAIMLEDAREILKINRANTYNIPISPDEAGVPIASTLAKNEEEEMHVGDIHNHTHQDVTESKLEEQQQKHESEIRRRESQFAEERRQIETSLTERLDKIERTSSERIRETQERLEQEREEHRREMRKMREDFDDELAALKKNSVAVPIEDA